MLQGNLVKWEGLFFLQAVCVNTFVCVSEHLDLSNQPSVRPSIHVCFQKPPVLSHLPKGHFPRFQVLWPDILED